MSRLWWFFLLYWFLESPLSATPLSKFDNGNMGTQTKREIESANEIFARRARKLLISLPASEQPCDQVYVASFLKNLESIGYAASESLIKACSKLSITDLTALNNDALNSLRKARGACCDQVDQTWLAGFEKRSCGVGSAEDRLCSF